MAIQIRAESAAGQFLISQGVPAAVSVDFDLAMSNSVDLDVDPPVVTVEPFLVALPELETDRAHRLRGALASVDEAGFVVGKDRGEAAVIVRYLEFIEAARTMGMVLVTV